MVEENSDDGNSHLIAYLEHDERKDYEGYLTPTAKSSRQPQKKESHIYNHVRQLARQFER